MARMKKCRLALMGLISLSLLLCSGAMHAQIYTCKDANGKTITADRPIPECAKQPMRELNKDGTTKRVIEAPLTPEQRQAKIEEEKRKQKELETLEEQKRRDRALLAAYNSEADLERARKLQIKNTEEDIALGAKRLHAVEKQLADVQKEYDAAQKRTGKAPGQHLQSRLTQAQAAVQSERAILESKREMIAKINEKFDRDLARFRELTK